MKNITFRIILIVLLFSAFNSFSIDKKDKKDILKTSKNAVSDLRMVKKIIGFNIFNSPVISINAESILNKSAQSEDSIPNLMIELDFQDKYWTTIYSERDSTNTAWNFFLFYKTFFTEDVSYPDSIIYSDYDIISEEWMETRKEIHNYYSAGLDTAFIAYLRDTLSGIWQPESKNIYSYDNNGNKTEDILLVWDPNFSEWITWTKNKYEYDGNLLISDEYLIWDDYSWIWISGSKTLYTYDILNRMETQTNFTIDYLEGGLIEYAKEKYLYIGDTENTDTIMAFSYDSEAETYKPEWFDKTNYSPVHGMITSEDTYSILNDENKSANEYTDFAKEYAWVYYYNDEASAIKRNRELINLIYPNPANDKIIIQTQKPENCRLQIFNLQGQLLSTKDIQSRITSVNISNLESGIYIFHLRNNGKSTTKKIVKQ